MTSKRSSNELEKSASLVLKDCVPLCRVRRASKGILHTTIEPIASNICVLYIFSASSLCTEGVQKKGSVYKLADDVLVLAIFPFYFLLAKIFDSFIFNTYARIDILYNIPYHRARLA